MVTTILMVNKIREQNDEHATHRDPTTNSWI